MNMQQFARQELEAAGFPMSINQIRPDANRLDELHAYDTAKCVMQLVQTLSQQGHSGGSIPPVISLFTKIARYQPLAPLQGNDEEWMDVSDVSGVPMWQNKRCAHVFKGSDGKAYDLNAIVYVEPDGATFTTGPSEGSYITFPYTPTTKFVYLNEDGLPR